jgi:hypothetical protein
MEHKDINRTQSIDLDEFIRRLKRHQHPHINYRHEPYYEELDPHNNRREDQVDAYS